MERSNTSIIIIGLLALVIGIAIKLFIGRRRFYRRNQAGLQGFSNYRNAVFIPFIEAILTFVAWLLIAVGLLFMAFAIITSK